MQSSWSASCASVVTLTLVSPGDFFEDFACRLGPDEGLGGCIVVFQIFHDGALQLGDAVEGAAADAVSGDLGKEAFDHVEPGRRGGREVQVIQRSLQVSNSKTASRSSKCRLTTPPDRPRHPISVIAPQPTRLTRRVPDASSALTQRVIGGA